jgi:DNA processing protein
MKNILLHLSLIDSIGAATIQKIIERKPATLAWADMYQLSVSTWCHTFDFSAQLAQKLVAGLSDMSLLETELQSIERHRVRWATVLDDDYPALLKHIHVPPIILYWQGADLGDEQSMAVVGSRDANQYGQDAIDALVPQLVAHNWTIVSGGALGIDSMAHRATVRAGGKTVVVLGSGLLQPQPRSNIRLFDDVLASGGAIVSSYSLDTHAIPGNFPARNRIIAGLSRGCIVVQAAEKSGARITAQFALEQGRDVFAVPGSIKDPLSAGCHKLVHEGAKLVHDVRDVLSEYGQDVQTNHVAAEISSDVQQKIIPAIVCQNEIQQSIVTACVQAISVDDLVVQTGIEMQKLQDELFTLQMNGLLEQDFTGLWRRI